MGVFGRFAFRAEGSATAGSSRTDSSGYISTDGLAPQLVTHEDDEERRMSSSAASKRQRRDEEGPTDDAFTVYIIDDSDLSLEIEGGGEDDSANESLLLTGGGGESVSCESSREKSILGAKTAGGVSNIFNKFSCCQ
jgi:hypothetical protein